MPLDLPAPGQRTFSSKESKRRRSFFGRVFSVIGWWSAGAIDWAGVRHLWRGASLIRDLSARLSNGSPRDPRFRIGEDREFDLEATAFLHGVSVFDLQKRLAERRRQTARIAYVTFALGWLSLTAWMCAAFVSPWTMARTAVTLEFLPFGVLFFLVAFYNALVNFQIRIGRLAGWREYLASNERFWPH
jgi:hypothetical protein